MGHEKDKGKRPSSALVFLLRLRGFGLLKEVGVLGDVTLHVVGDLVLGVDGLDRALGLARLTVYALLWVDKELVPTVVDAVNRTNLDARLVLCALRHSPHTRVLLDM